MRINQQTKTYIAENSFPSTGEDRLVADVYGIPARVEKTLTRLFGRPETKDRGEVAYWTVPAAVAAACED